MVFVVQAELALLGGISMCDVLGAHRPAYTTWAANPEHCFFSYSTAFYLSFNTACFFFRPVVCADRHLRYATSFDGVLIVDDSSLIHDFYTGECERPVHLVVDTALKVNTAVHTNTPSSSLGATAQTLLRVAVPRMYAWSTHTSDGRK